MNLAHAKFRIHLINQIVKLADPINPVRYRAALWRKPTAVLSQMLRDFQSC